MTDHTPSPWEATAFAAHFSKEDGVIETVEDVIETMGESALKRGPKVLYGVSQTKTDFINICYTGNGLQGLDNAYLIAAAPDLLEALKTIVFDWDGEPEDIIPAQEAIAKAKVPT